MALYVGVSGYSYREWKGKFYPKNLPANEMLRFYGEHFQAVEINSTFYKLPNASTLKAWKEAAPAGFKFALKAPRRITHLKRLKDAGDVLSQFLEVAETLARRRGPLLFQLPPTAKKDAPRLLEFLALLPSQLRIAFEFRHPSWFDDEIFSLLGEHRAALCIADADDDLEIPFLPSADWGYLRLRRHDYSPAKLKAWTKRVREFGWRDAYVFFKHDDEGNGPRLAKRFTELAG